MTNRHLLVPKYSSPVSRSQKIWQLDFERLLDKSIINGQFVSVVGCVILNERIDGDTSGREIRNHVKLFIDNDLSIQNVVICIVATVHDVGEIHHHACGVALAVGASVRLVGRQAIVGQKLVFALTVDDDASAGAFHFRSKVDPSACHIKCLILDGVWVNREAKRSLGPVRVLGIVFARLHNKKCNNSDKKANDSLFLHVKRT